MNFRSRMRAGSGGVAERLIAPVLKTGRPKGLVSSNLTPSATSLMYRGTQQPAWQRLFCEVRQRSLNCDFLGITTPGGYLYFVFATVSAASQ